MRLFFFIAFIISPMLLFAQLDLEGIVLDETDNPVEGALIKISGKSSGSITNSKGQFKIKSPKGSLLEISHINFETIFFTVTNSKKINVKLTRKSTTLKELKIEAAATQDMTKATLSEIESLPVFLGENDILKYLVTLPGISSISTFDAGISIRGGSTTENVFLVNSLGIADPKHISTLVTAYDPYILRGSQIFKSGYPAKYNGYLSGFVDMSTRSEIPDQPQGEISLGWISSSVKGKVPLGKKKNHLISVSARQSYLNLIAGMYERRLEGTNLPHYTLRDLTLSYQGEFTKGWEVAAFGLMSSDDMPFILNEKQSHNLKWNANSGVFTLSKKFKSRNKLAFNMAVNTSESKNNTVGELSKEIRTENETYTGRISYEDFFLDNWFINTGFQYEQKKYTYFDQVDTGTPDMTVAESKYGLYSHYASITRFVNDFTFEAGVNTTYFDGKTTSLDFSPRIKATYTTKDWELWADYARTLQFEERLAFFTIRSPIDMSIPLGETNKPAYSDQFSVGFSKTIFQSLKFTSSIFYKNMNHLKDFTNSSRASLDFLSIEMLEGVGYAYGVETELAFSVNGIDCRTSYTLSNSKREFDEINGGEEFRPPYDVRHSANIAASYQLGEAFSFNALWMYTSGIFITMPEGVAVARDITKPSSLANFVPIYGDRYNYQLPNRHRLDLSVGYLKKFVKNAMKITVGTYNTYGHDNVDFVYLEVEPVDDYLIKFVPKSRLVLPFVPYFSFTFYFNNHGN